MHRRYLAELDHLVVTLHQQGGQDWAVAARRALRRRLAEAAKIEMALVSGSATPR